MERKPVTIPEWIPRPGLAKTGERNILERLWLVGLVEWSEDRLVTKSSTMLFLQAPPQGFFEMPKRRRKRNKKQAKTFREPVPGELERDEESWSGAKVTLACSGVVAVLFLGWLAWQSLLAAGVVGAILSIGFTVGPYVWDLFKHMSDD